VLSGVGTSKVVNDKEVQEMNETTQEVALEEETQSHPSSRNSGVPIGLLQQCRRKIRVRLLVLNAGSNRGPYLGAECSGEWKIRNRISSPVKEKPHESGFPCEQHIVKGNRSDLRSVLDQQLNEIQPAQWDWIGEGSILRGLVRVVLGDQFHKAMETGLNRNLKQRFALSILSDGNIERLGSSDPFFYFVQPPRSAELDYSFGESGAEVGVSAAIFVYAWISPKFYAR
jgi:hypothetical protein